MIIRWYYHNNDYSAIIEGFLLLYSRPCKEYFWSGPPAGKEIQLQSQQRLQNARRYKLWWIGMIQGTWTWTPISRRMCSHRSSEILTAIQDFPWKAGSGICLAEKTDRQAWDGRFLKAQKAKIQPSGWMNTEAVSPGKRMPLLFYIIALSIAGGTYLRSGQPVWYRPVLSIAGGTYLVYRQTIFAYEKTSKSSSCRLPWLIPRQSFKMRTIHSAFVIYLLYAFCNV